MARGDFVDAIVQLCNRWQRQIDDRFQGLMEMNKGEKCYVRRLLELQQDVMKYERDPRKLLLAYRAFREWYALNRSGVPRWFHFLAYLKQKADERARNEEGDPLRDNPCQWCSISGHLPVAVPGSKEDQWQPDPDIEGYVPGEKWDRTRLLSMSVPCVCLGDAGDFTDLRERHIEWYGEAKDGSWALHPDDPMTPDRACILYVRRSRHNDWEPKDPKD